MLNKFEPDAASRTGALRSSFQAHPNGNSKSLPVDETGPARITAPKHSAYDERLDQLFRAGVARFTGGVSPAALWIAYLDWAIHLGLSPGKQIKLGEKALQDACRLVDYLSCLHRGASARCIEPTLQDKRFASKRWSEWPFNMFSQSFLLAQAFWKDATDIAGVTPQHRNVVNFAARQWLDMLSPSNFPWANPEIIDRTIRDNGMNFVRGFVNAADDVAKFTHGKPMESGYEVGRNLAVTPGKVIFRNDLMELIQYSPTTDAVYPEPVLIVPAWIMKYYILDLSASNSLVRYLVDEGLTVFMVSWKNPAAEDRDYGMDDYRRLGPMAALDAIGSVCPGRKVHALGYCLGGTLLAIAAAAMARDGDERLQSLTLLAAQTDFSEPGELELFVDESHLIFLDAMMRDQGFLDGRQMAQTFHMLRSNDLIWSRMLRHYWLGERGPMSDLMAWNADSTRLPHRMHIDYLRKIFLENRLAKGQYLVDQRPIALRDIRAPIFAVGTEWDHVAPWQSVYRLRLLADTEITFLLTNGGHNAGVVSPQYALGRRHRVSKTHHDDAYIPPDAWVEKTPACDGSWWPLYIEWLQERSGAKTAPPSMGMPDKGLTVICDAPGTYVFQR